MNRSKRIRKCNFSKYMIWIIACLVLSVVFGTEVQAADSRPTIRSVIPRAIFPEDVMNATMLPESIKRLELSQRKYGWFDFEIFKEYKAIGINYLTLSIHWIHVEKKPGEFDFSYIDPVMNMARDAGLKVIMRLGPYSPDWFWTYGKETALTKEEVDKCMNNGKIDFLEKLSVYPAIGANGKACSTGAIDPWDATGNYLKLRYLTKACRYLEEKYSDVVDYVDAGYLGEGTWGLGSIEIKTGPPRTWIFYTTTWAPTALAAYRRYIQEKYLKIADVNKIYKTNWKSFGEAIPPKTYEDTKYFWDWHKFLERGMVALFMREAAIVRRAGFKVSVLCHFYSGDLTGVSYEPGQAADLYCRFTHPGRIELIDADLYIVGGGWNNITWDDTRPYDIIKNPLVIIPYEGTDILRSMRKKTDALFIMEDWGPNPALAEFMGLSAAMLDGFQIIEGTFDKFLHQGKYWGPDYRTVEEMYEEFKEAINTFWVPGRNKK